MEKVKFAGIDNWNRPIFRSTQYPKNFFGSISKLFNHDTSREEVLNSVLESDLCFFGNSFGCEPMGTPAIKIEIVR